MTEIELGGAAKLGGPASLDVALGQRGCVGLEAIDDRERGGRARSSPDADASL